MLSNGSLLIVNSQLSDSGKFRCNVTNQFTKKLFRNWFSMLSVVSRPENADNHGSRLLPKLQSSDQKIKSGQNLVLHCASEAKGKVRQIQNEQTTEQFSHPILSFLVILLELYKPQILWTFTPRSSNIPINLTDFNNELRYVNVSVTKHDGIYNCSTESDFQVNIFIRNAHFHFELYFEAFADAVHDFMFLLNRFSMLPS